MRTRALVSIMALLLASSGAAAQTAAHAPHEGALAASPSKTSTAAFGAAMRALWEDHLVWTRQFIVSAIAGLPDRDVAAKRLLRNQQDIGDAIKPFYGNQAGDSLAALLRDHITIAADLVGAAKQGNNDLVKSKSAAWYANADAISAFLGSANSNWKAEDLRATMHMHLDLTLKEAVARLQQDWNADIAAYDGIHQHILGMADVLSSGIVRQFPSRFTK